MSIISISINNIEIREELTQTTSEKNAIDWDIKYECEIHENPNKQFILVFIPIHIIRNKAGNCAKMTIRTSFIIECDNETLIPSDPSDLLRFAELIIIAKAHARSIFYLRTSQTLFMPSQLPYISLEQELGEIDTTRFTIIRD